MIFGAISGGGSDSKPSESKPKWNMNFADPAAGAKNLEHCVKLMRKMDNVAANAQKVSPADVMSNIEAYMGQVPEFGATVTEMQDAPPGSGTAKVFGGSAHAMVATTDDGVTVIATRKGDQTSDKSKVGAFTVIVGMPVGIQKLPDDLGKVLLIAGNPK